LFLIESPTLKNRDGVAAEGRGEEKRKRRKRWRKRE